MVLNVKLQARGKNGLFWCDPQDLGTVVTLKPIRHHDLKDPATGCIKVRGEGSVIRPKARVAMWQRNHLWGDLVTGFWKS